MLLWALGPTGIRLMKSPFWALITTKPASSSVYQNPVGA